MKKLAAASALLFSWTVSAFAAVPVEATAALTGAATDATTVGGLALAAVVAGVAFKYMRRAL